MRHLLFLPVLGLIATLLSPHNAAAQTYTVTDLGLLPGTQFSTTTGINNVGDIIGYSGDYLGGLPLGPSQAFLYHDGKMMAFSPAGLSLSLFGISLHGEKDPWGGPDDRHKLLLTGFATFSATQSGAFLYKDHFVRSLGFLPGGHSSIGYGVNASGDVVGSADDENYIDQAFLYKHGNMIGLGALGGNGATAWGINDRGDVTGEAGTTSNTGHAFLYHDGAMFDLGTLTGSTDSIGRAINNSRQVTGWAYTLDGTFEHAFLSEKGKMLDLGVLPGGTISIAYAINDQGDVVGAADVVVNSADRGAAFLYTQGKMFNLNDLIPANSGWTLASAFGINDRGEIAGVGDIQGEEHAFLLTPRCHLLGSR